MWRGSILSSCPNRFFYHQMAIPSLHAVSRCIRVSRLSQCLHRSDPTSLMAYRHSLVGTCIACTTVYHIDLVSSAIQALCKFFHTCFQFVSGYRCVILIPRDSFASAAIMYRVRYTCRLKVRSFSSFAGGTI
jgi:hypothetical protein